MRRKLLLFLIISFLTSPLFAQESPPFLGIYWIAGSITGDVSLEGEKIYFANQKAYDLIGREGRSGKANHFLINAFAAEVPLTCGAKYKIFTKRIKIDTAEYGIGPVEIEISGRGLEETRELTAAQGGGVETALLGAMGVEASPELKIWIDGRLYQKKLVEQGEKFIIGKMPKIKVELKEKEPYGVKIEPVIIDEATPAVRSFSIQEKEASKVFAAGVVKAMEVESTLPYALEEGEHTLSITASSLGKLGAPAQVVEKIKVTVLGGPLRIVDIPITFPSPFSPTKNKEVTIQYTLSDNANVDIYIYSIAGELIKRFSCPAGTEGGAGQLNKVKWNGIMDVGGVVGNGIYVGTIVSRDDNKVLGKFKLNVFD